jgi:hypothetical protein
MRKFGKDRLSPVLRFGWLYQEQAERCSIHRRWLEVARFHSADPTQQSIPPWL